jgi:hypothetical protein
MQVCWESARALRAVRQFSWLEVRSSEVPLSRRPTSRQRRLLGGKWISPYMGGKTVQFLERYIHWLFGIMLGVQIVGFLSLLFMGIFIAGASGGLDMMEFDPPGLDETCMMLPFAFPLTLVSYMSFPRLKKQKWVAWFMVFTTIVNVILAIQVIKMVYLLSRIFS